MTSEVSICNMALGNIGVSQTIANLDEPSKEAKACKRYYEQSVNEVLRKFPWPFATRYVTLALVEEAPNNQWDYSYRHPSNCEMVRRVIPSNIGVSDNYRSPFVLASDNVGKLIWSNEPLALAEITYRMTDPTTFDSIFVKALSWLLGSKISPSLSGNRAKEIIDRAMGMYQVSINEAGNAAFNEQEVDKRPDTEFLRARE